MIYSQNEKWTISTSALYAPFDIIEFQAVTTLQQYALSQWLDFALEVEQLNANAQLDVFVGDRTWILLSNSNTPPSHSHSDWK